MRRPQIINFFAISTNNFISVKASVVIKKNSLSRNRKKDQKKPSIPLHGFFLFRMNRFKLKVIGHDNSGNELFQELISSDYFGNFFFKIRNNSEIDNVEKLTLYELGTTQGLEYYLGEYELLKLSGPRKVVVSDFDKTLVETKYSTLFELLRSLTSPLTSFPSISSSCKILRSYAEEGHKVFILSASPHFYENAIRDWLKKEQLNAVAIFLKDFRQVFSKLTEKLMPKDLLSHGMYKLGHLVDILLMTGIPDEIVLLGDNFESDPIIYLTFASIITDDLEPWPVWNSIRKEHAFKLNKRQKTTMLNKIYQLKNLIAQKKKIEGDDWNINLKIYIRKKSEDDQIKMDIDFLRAKIPIIQTYV